MCEFRTIIAIMNTINISLPENMYRDVKKISSNRGYSSVSELVRDALRKILYSEVTTSGFSREFENEVLESSAQSPRKDIVLKTNQDINKYFRKFSEKAGVRKKKDAKN